jgi:hypothetical protein
MFPQTQYPFSRFKGQWLWQATKGAAWGQVNWPWQRATLASKYFGFILKVLPYGKAMFLLRPAKVSASM